MKIRGARGGRRRAGDLAPGSSASGTADTAAAALSVSDLRVQYGQVRAVNGISIEVQPGRCLAVLGPNGAGKTSLLRAVAGIVRPHSGDIRIFGSRTAGAPAHKIARSGVSLLQEGRGIFPKLTVADNIKVVTAQVGEDSLADAMSHFPRLRERRGQVAGTMSGGEQQMLALLLALLRQPKLLLADEPSLGLAPRIVGEIFDVFHSIRQAGTTIVVVEQFVHMAVSLADDVIVMQKGQIVTSGPVAQFQGTAGEEILNAYLGQSSTATETERQVARDAGLAHMEQVELTLPAAYLRFLEQESTRSGVSIPDLLSQAALQVHHDPEERSLTNGRH